MNWYVHERSSNSPLSIFHREITYKEAKTKQVNNSGLKIFSIEDLQSAAEKVVEFSKIVKMARDIDVGVEFSLGI